jgi:hypothetical protein
MLASVTASVVAPTPPRAPMTESVRGLAVALAPPPRRRRARAAPARARPRGPSPLGERQREVVAEADRHQVAVERHVVDPADADHDAAAGQRVLSAAASATGSAAGRVDDQQIELARPFAQRQRRVDRALADVGLAQRQAEQVRRDAALRHRIGDEADALSSGLSSAAG